MLRSDPTPADGFIPGTRAAQALAILDALEAWCEARPFRGFTAMRAADEWRVTLADGTSSGHARGVTLADALSQIATVAGLDGSAA